MARQRHGFVTLLGIAVLFSGFGLDGCGRKRPSNIPSDSVYVEGGKACWWQRCSYDPNQDSDHCQIFNMGGLTLYDETFLPYDGGKAAKASELNIDGNSIPTGPDYVHLKNGRILIPRSQFELQKHFLDSLSRIDVVRHK